LQRGSDGLQALSEAGFVMGIDFCAARGPAKGIKELRHRFFPRKNLKNITSTLLSKVDCVKILRHRFFPRNIV
jgi:hypothetical protein